ncbi:MAG TPA: hypothetical protein VF101_11405 [Gaiellaceae bacterium]
MRRPGATVVLASYAFAVFFGVFALTAAVVGIHDAALSRSGLGTSIGSAALLATTIVLTIATVQLFALTRRSRWKEGEHPPCKPFVLIAFLLTSLFGVYIFFSAIRTGGDQRPYVVAVAVAMTAAALFGLWFFGRDARVTLPRVGTIALGLVGTTIGAWEFWYQNQYLPARAGQAVALKAELQLADRQGEYDIVRANIDYEDTTGRSVAVVGSTYSLTGSRVIRCQRPADATRVRKFFNSALVDPQRVRFMADVLERQPPAVLAAGKFVGDGKRLDPDVPAVRDFVFLVPHQRYQLIRLRAQLFAIPASVQLSQRKQPQYVSYPGDNRLYGFWHVDDDSWLRDLIYGRERWVVMRYELVRSSEAKATSPDLRVLARFPDPSWGAKPPSRAEVDGLFAKPHPSDASEPFADSELALGPVGEPQGDECSKLLEKRAQATP